MSRLKRQRREARIRANGSGYKIDPQRAERIANQLLWRFLDVVQRKQLDTYGVFEVASPHQPGVVYQITCAGYVYLFEGSICKGRLCVGPTVSLPVSDQALSHLLHILGNEDEYRSTANLIIHQGGERQRFSNEFRY